MAYQRVLLKLSGEALQGAQPHGIDRIAVETFAQGIIDARDEGVEIAVLVGGGNLFRGAELIKQGYGRATGDSIGMLATVINGLALQDVLEAMGAETRLATSLKMDEVAEPYIRRRAIRHLERGRIVLLAGGLGRPYISTDTAAVQRALELGASAINLVHNHPSGDPAPSPEDVRLTEQIVEAGKLLDIPLLDHIIIGRNSFVSLKERKLGFD